ncbi:MAG: DUF4968 domain-containing protein [Sedimentisphaerales bacterium]|nr:DUF4968 domain-containing protein [Sedimentisphaerales bacterium]
MDKNTSEVFPQYGAGTGAADSSIVNTQKGPSFFKYSGGVNFMRAMEVVSVEQKGGNIVAFSCKTEGLTNKFMQTHETQMLQRHINEDLTGVLDFEVAFWSASIFRVRFSPDTIPSTEPDFPPIAGRMLAAEPDSNVQINVEDGDEALTISTSEVRLVIEKKPFAMRAYDNDGKLFWQQWHERLLTSDMFEASFVESGDRKACFESFVIEGQEEIYGLGERFDYVARKGKPVDFWNKDAVGTSNRRSYINVPFLWSTAGYGLFVNSSSRTEWEVATSEAYSLGFAVEDSCMDYFVIHGPSPKEIIYKYCQLTGFSPVPPIWSFGLWMSRNSYVSWDVVDEVAKELRDRDIPADVLHLDTAWFEEDWNCDLRFSKSRFAEPEKHMRKLKEDGFRVSLWQYNFVPPKENNINYKEGVEKGYFAKNSDGTPFCYPPGTTGAWVDDLIIDFSNPQACRWYADQISDLIRLGAATIKTDFGEGIPEDACFQNISGKKFHNLYTLVYNAVVAEAIERVSGESVVWARSGTAGSQRYPIHWGGDSQCSWAGLAGTLRGALSMGLSGFVFFSHDIGGFIGRPTPELYIRWAQFGMFCSHARCHGAGNNNSREPWSFGDEAEEIFRKYAKLRYRLLPYILEQAARGSRTGEPLVRALVLEYPQDRNVRQIEDEYLFGESMLIAPVLEPLEHGNKRSIYLPAGTWIDYWSKETIVSTGQWIERDIDLETMPIYVKAGSIIAYGPERNYTNNEIDKIAALEVYSGRDVKLEYDYDSIRFSVKLENNRLSVSGLGREVDIKVFGSTQEVDITYA